jgi:catechol 2,3-dioxygenase-like lactoylglutathione lyase family enzyme
MISKVDFVGIPSTDTERTRAFYVETLGLRPDEHGRFEFWAGETCFGIWEPSGFGEILDTGVCHMAFFNDPDGNDLMLHHRYAPYE